MIRMVLKNALDVIMVLFAGAMIIALAGGAKFELFGSISISLHRFPRPFTYFLAALCLRLWVSSPSGLSVGQTIDYWLERAKIKIRNITVLPNGQIRRPYGIIFCIMGLRIPDTDTVWNGRRVIAIITFLLVIFLTLSPTYRYLNHVSVPDLGIFLESMDSAIKGGMFENSFHFWMFHSAEEFLMSKENTISMFASHFRPILFLFLPAYRLVPSAITLFFLQALIVGASVWPFFLLSRRFLKREDWAIAATVCYSLYPSVLSTSWSFFPGAFTITFLLWAFWFSSQNRYILMLSFLLLTLATKEIMALPVLSFGAYIFFFKRKRAMGVAITAFAILYLLACLFWIIPSFGAGLGYHYTKTMYQSFGTSLGGILATIILKPWKMFPYIFSASAIRYLFGLLFPVAFLPVLGWRLWVLNLPVLAQNILAGSPPGKMYCRIPGGLWSAPLVPFTFMSVLWALSFIRDKFSDDRIRHILTILIITSLLSLPIAIRHNHWPNQTYKKAVSTFRQLAPEKAVVSTNILSGWGQLRLRYRLYRYPKNVGQADFVFVAIDPDLNPANPNNVRWRRSKHQGGWEYVEYEHFKRLEEDHRFVELWKTVEPSTGHIIGIYKRMRNPVDR